MGFTEILLMDEHDPEKLESLAVSKRSGEMLLHLINGILDFTEIESGKIKLTIRDFSIDNLLEGIFQRFDEFAGEKKILLEIKKNPSVPAKLRGDEHRIAQVIANLVDNGIKFTKKGRVRVECAFENGAAVFRVSDSGIGIPVEKQEDIFSFFSQLDMTTTRNHEGIGLGLTVVKKLVELMEGTISLQSTPGVGSTFTVRLPVAEA
jgi:signal transduction histidine kinase